MPSAAVSAHGRIQIGRDVLGKREVASVLGRREQAEEKFAHAGRSTASANVVPVSRRLSLGDIPEAIKVVAWFPTKVSQPGSLFS
jgi:hypothetical protein